MLLVLPNAMDVRLQIQLVYNVLSIMRILEVIVLLVLTDHLQQLATIHVLLVMPAVMDATKLLHLVSYVPIITFPQAQEQLVLFAVMVSSALQIILVVLTVMFLATDAMEQQPIAFSAQSIMNLQSTPPVLSALLVPLVLKEIIPVLLVMPHVMDATRPPRLVITVQSTISLPSIQLVLFAQQVFIHLLVISLV